MPQRFNGSWNASYPDESWYSGHVRIEVRNNTFQMITGDIFRNNVYDSWWTGSNWAISGDRLTLRYNILSMNGRWYRGNLDITMQNPNLVSGRYVDDNNGGTGRFTLTRIGNEYRQMNVEIDAITGVAWPPTVNHNMQAWDLAGIYRNAGIQLNVNLSNNNIPNPGGPFTNMALHNIMTNWSPGRNPANWQGYLLMATTNPAGDLGIMFDLPPQPTPSREGAAVFVNQINTSVPAAGNLEVLRTAAHEFGHSLNLLHPASPGTTIMNQTRVLQNLGGYPNNINYTFRNVNIEHMRHHRYPLVVFGGSRFGSDPHSNLQLKAVERMYDRRLEITISPSKSILKMSEPCYLEIVIRNISEDSIPIESDVSASAGTLRLVVHTPSGKTREIYPSIIRNITSKPHMLTPKNELVAHLTLFLDRYGPIFDAPGRYEVEAEYIGICDRPWLAIRSQPIPIRILHPTPVQENAMIELESYGPRMYCELEGADHLDKSLGAIREIIEHDDLTPLQNHLLFIDSKRYSAPFYNLIEDSERPINPQKSESLLNAVNLGREKNPIFEEMVRGELQKLKK